MVKRLNFGPYQGDFEKYSRNAFTQLEKWSHEIGANSDTLGGILGELNIDSTAIYPDATDGLALGKTTAAFADLYLAEGGTINWDDGDAVLAQAGNAITWAGIASMSPSSNDGGTLGTTSLGWSDLHLATGGVINWANGEVTITETDANTLTVAGATSLAMGTSIAVGLGTIELGHASDTTISRAASGIIAVEGTALGPVNVQTFTSTGTWTKPTQGTIALIRAWGGGGSGGVRTTTGTASGGGGGAFMERWIALSSLGATEDVTLGDGGAAVASSNAVGLVGGNTTFGAHLTAYGGGAGFHDGAGSTVSGGGGGNHSAAGTAGSGSVETMAGMLGTFYGLSTTAALPSTGAFYSGGGGGITSGNAVRAGGVSVMGGAGGGGTTSGGGGDDSSGGASVFGGAGGNGSSTAPTAGTQPGGGGGGARNGQASGAGAKGQVVVYVF